MSNDSDITQSLEAALQQLQQKVAWFHSDAFSLDEATTRFQEVTALANDVEQRLKSLQREVEVLAKRFDEPS